MAPLRLLAACVSLAGCGGPTEAASEFETGAFYDDLRTDPIGTGADRLRGIGAVDWGEQLSEDEDFTCRETRFRVGRVDFTGGDLCARQGWPSSWDGFAIGIDPERAERDVVGPIAARLGPPKVTVDRGDTIWWWYGPTIQVEVRATWWGKVRFLALSNANVVEKTFSMAIPPRGPRWTWPRPASLPNPGRPPQWRTYVLRPLLDPPYVTCEVPDLRRTHRAEVWYGGLERPERTHVMRGSLMFVPDPDASRAMLYVDGYVPAEIRWPDPEGPGRCVGGRVDLEPVARRATTGGSSRSTP